MALFFRLADLIDLVQDIQTCILGNRVALLNVVFLDFTDVIPEKVIVNQACVILIAGVCGNIKDRLLFCLRPDSRLDFLNRGFRLGVNSLAAALDFTGCLKVVGVNLVQSF